LTVQTRLNRTLRSLQEFYKLEENEEWRLEEAMSECPKRVVVPNYPSVYGDAYHMVQPILEQYDHKAVQRALKVSIDEVTLAGPFPILAYESEFMRKACEHLKLESRRLLRVFYVCASKLARKIFCLCLWLYLCRH